MISSYQCPSCGSIYRPETLQWRCRCRGAFVLEKTLPLSKAIIEKELHSMWRCRPMLPVDRPISLGEGGTPVVEAQIQNVETLLRLECLAPRLSKGVAVIPLTRSGLKTLCQT